MRVMDRAVANCGAFFRLAAVLVIVSNLVQQFAKLVEKRLAEDHQRRTTKDGTESDLLADGLPPTVASPVYFGDSSRCVNASSACRVAASAWFFLPSPIAALR